MADHSFFGTVSVSEPGTDDDHILQKAQVDDLIEGVESDLTSGLAGKADTGHTHSADAITDGTTNRVFTDAEKTKLSGVATGATANATDASLRDFSLSTGVRDHTAISDFDTAVNALIETVVDAEGATEALNTLAELAAALGSDENFSTTVTGMITAIDTRVDALEADTGTSAYKANIGNATDSLITVTHGLGTVDVDVIVRRVSDGQRVYPVEAAATTDTVTIDFASHVPAGNAYRVIVTPA